MREPTGHPGEIIEFYLKSLKISQVDFANHLGVSFQTVNCIINKKRGISTEMAFLLSDAFYTTPEYWLELQMKYDLRQFKKRKSVTCLLGKK